MRRFFLEFKGTCPCPGLNFALQKRPEKAPRFNVYSATIYTAYHSKKDID
jgi:hypothetical protein